MCDLLSRATEAVSAASAATGNDAATYCLFASGSATRAESCWVGCPCYRGCAVLISQNASFVFVGSMVWRDLKILCCAASAAEMCALDYFVSEKQN